MAIAAATALALTLSAGPAAAVPPDRSEETFTILFPDLPHGLVVFINTDRATYCTPEVIAWEYALLAWLDGGMMGDPPAEPAFPAGFDPISIQAKETGQGALVSSAAASGLVMELWNMDAPENAPLIGPCSDTDDEGSFFARGATSFRGNDNDVFVSGTRGNAFGDRGRGTLTDGEGDAWVYWWVFHVNDRCYEPGDGPPACLIDRSSLQAR